MVLLTLYFTIKAPLYTLPCVICVLRETQRKETFCRIHDIILSVILDVENVVDSIVLNDIVMSVAAVALASTIE